MKKQLKKEALFSDAQKLGSIHWFNHLKFPGRKGIWYFHDYDLTWFRSLVFARLRNISTGEEIKVKYGELCFPVRVQIDWEYL